METQLLSYYNQYIQKIERDKKNGYDRELSRQFFLSKAEPISGNILEIGTGKGYLTTALAQKGYHFTSIDISPQEREFAFSVLSHLGLAGNVKLVVSDARNMPFVENNFDTIISCNTLHHIGDVMPAINEMLRILKPQGKIVLGDFSRCGMDMIGKMHSSNGSSHDYEAVDFNKIGKYLENKGFKVKKHGNKLHNILIGYEKNDE
ncbi:MAG: class I SAM-dependent methyltransferase [Endomicrobiales bacterium]|nr:class I SAM-dependent methyltransferase [Endomicrobiales bacterium]